jgi:hypothetical protein
MNTCGACKNKHSFEKCYSKCLKGLLFCGKHAKSKHPRIWAILNKIEPKVILIQRCWRGYFIRNWIKLAGPGAMNRSKCHNEEELITMDSKDSVYPLDYFGFVETDKLYWFDFKSLWECMLMNKTPLNPYTRQPISIEVRKRARRIAFMRDNKKIPNKHDTQILSLAAATSKAWLQVSQIIEENGFFDINPILFESLNNTQLYLFLYIISNDLRIWAQEHPRTSYRHKYYQCAKIGLTTHKYSNDSLRFSFLVARFLLLILQNFHEQYSLCFIIMSSLHRM